MNNTDKHVDAAEIQEALNVCERIHKNFIDICADTKRYFVESYGCQMNDHDAERLAGMLKIMGYIPANDKMEADFIIFNTCCVREHAEKRVFGNIGALRKLKEAKPSLIIGVCGCMMQQHEVSDRLFKRFPFVDLVFGTHELHRFPQMLEQALLGKRVLEVRDMDGEIPEGLPTVRDNKFTTNLVVMYGCNNFCSYCIVPYVRGRERSRSPKDILAEAYELARVGYKEVTLLGQNVNSYRTDDGLDFADILAMVNDVPGIERVRFMTSHPKDLSDRLIEAMATLDKVCNHIHLPVQSGSDRILSLMNRHYDVARYIEITDKLRERVPGVEITTDIIVGFPTETDDDFRATIDIVKRVGHSAAYTFMYSPRSGTKAAVMDGQIAEEVKKERLFELNNACSAVLQERNRKYIGIRGKVLVEGIDEKKHETAFGKLTNFKMVYFPAEQNIIGQTIDIEITDAQNNSLIGKAVTD